MTPQLVQANSIGQTVTASVVSLSFPSAVTESNAILVSFYCESANALTFTCKTFSGQDPATTVVNFEFAITSGNGYLLFFLLSNITGTSSEVIVTASNTFSSYILQIVEASGLVPTQGAYEQAVWNSATNNAPVLVTETTFSSELAYGFFVGLDLTGAPPSWVLVPGATTGTQTGFGMSLELNYPQILAASVPTSGSAFWGGFLVTLYGYSYPWVQGGQSKTFNAGLLGLSPLTTRMGNGVLLSTSDLDFLAAQNYLIDLTPIIQSQKPLYKLQAVYIDNSQGQGETTLTIVANGQRIIAPSGTEGYYPLVALESSYVFQVSNFSGYNYQGEIGIPNNPVPAYQIAAAPKAIIYFVNIPEVAGSWVSTKPISRVAIQGLVSPRFLNTQRTLLSWVGQTLVIKSVTFSIDPNTTLSAAGTVLSRLMLRSYGNYADYILLRCMWNVGTTGTNYPVFYFGNLDIRIPAPDIQAILFDLILTSTITSGELVVAVEYTFE